MAASKKISKIASLEKLEFIRVNVTEHLDESRVKACVESFRNNDQISTLLRLFSEMNIRFAEESDTLQENAPEYNSKYATKFNGKFSLAYQTLNDIKKQVFFLYKIMNVLSAKPSTKYGYPHTDTTTIEYTVSHTMLGTLSYTPSMFDNNTESQKRLIDEIVSFIKYLDSNLKLCANTLKDEERISKDEKETKEVFV